MCKHVCVCVGMCVALEVCSYVYTHGSMTVDVCETLLLCVYTHVCMTVCELVCYYICVHMWVYVSLFMCVCVHVYDSVCDCMCDSMHLECNTDKGRKAVSLRRLPTYTSQLQLSNSPKA